MRKFATAVFIMLAMLAITFGGIPYRTKASSHREAPHIISDPLADGTDLYAFVSNDRRDSVTLIANYVPLQLPSNGPNYYRFGNDVLYEINVDNDGDAKEDITFQFRFRTEVRNQETVAYTTGPVTSLDDPDLNVRQFYSVAVLGKAGNDDPSRSGAIIADNLPVAPYNAGPNSFPDYEPVAMQAVRDIGNGIKVFAGPRDDPFFVDVGGIFDLLKGIKGRDALNGLNIHTIAIQVPIVGLKGPNDNVIGVTTRSYRASDTVLREQGKVNAKSHVPIGKTTPVTQVSRLGMPLVNEAVIPLALKDTFNTLKPAQDAVIFTSGTPAGELLKKSVLDPELARDLTKQLGVKTPAPPRNDIFTIFLTGIPDLNKPANVVPAEQLRLNMAIPPSANPNRMGLLGGDMAGFPNGRRPMDDVTDIEIQAVAGATPFTPGFEANNKLGDGANGNDKPFKNTFPYLAEPHVYTENDK
jgi:hypothetical protein